jgi:hypothetical protein
LIFPANHRGLRPLGFANSPIAASVSLNFAFESRSNGQRQARSRIFSGDFHTAPKNPHFSSLFCDFSLRSALPLAIVPCGPSFSVNI